MKIIMLVFIVVAISVLFVLTDNNIRLNNNQALADFSTKYISFIGNSIYNFADITGYIIQLNWKNYSG